MASGFPVAVCLAVGYLEPLLHNRWGHDSSWVEGIGARYRLSVYHYGGDFPSWGACLGYRL